MELIKTSEKISIKQSAYIDELVNRFELQDARGKSSPYFDTKDMFMWGGDDKISKPYRQLIGSLQYCANCTRPDILFPVNFLARFNQDPRERHWMAAKSILRYLKETRDYAIEYTRGEKTIKAYSDSDFANDPEQRQSTSGGIILVARGPIIFLSRRQTLVGLSSTESEYVAACEITRELTWLKQFLSELNIEMGTPVLNLDNQSTIKQIQNGDTNRRNKHVDIKYHFVRKAFQDELFKLNYTPTGEQIADFLTKNLNGNKLKELVTKSGINTGNQGSLKMGKPAIISLLVITALGMSMVSEGIKFRKADPILWVPSQYYIDIGVNYYNIEYTYSSPCDA